MLLTTTDIIPGKDIEACLGLVSGCAVVGDAYTKKFSGGIRDISMGKPHDYVQELEDARNKAIAQMVARAEKVGADAICGITIDFEMAGGSTAVVIASVSGTAVRLIA